MGANKARLTSPKLTWLQLRSRVTSDDTLQSSSGLDYADWAGDTDGIDLSDDQQTHAMNAIDIAFYGTDAANEDADYYLWGRRRGNGPIVLLASGVVTLGTAVATSEPISGTTVADMKWADTITVTDGLWADADYTTVYDSGSNRVAILRGDIFGLEDLYMQFDLDGGSTTSASMGAIFSGV